MNGVQIREKFLDFFAKKGHTIKESASLVPSDATVLFTIAGMVPFKPHFLGEIDPLPFTRAASSQRCIRTNDIENVGHTARHHTFFEMLGNFSFGDYFKEEAISWAWEFLTEVVCLPVDKLWVSVYKEDNEAEQIWRRFIKSERIVRLGEDDNFWKMGDTGPCGPCSEILYDQGQEVGCGKLDCMVGCSCDRYLELWNLVFTQFDRDSQGNLHPLPKKNIDTGMGLERLSAVLQGVQSNFDCDLLKNIIQYTADMIKATNIDPLSRDISLRIIADHLRAITFLIYDGILPSNEGRGYVLRSLIRRAARQGKLIGLNETFLYKIVPTVTNLFSIPQLTLEQEQISKIIKIEEERFAETLEKGLAILEEIALSVKKKGQQMISGSDAFRLYDTYGFPLALTKEIAQETGLMIDELGFNQAMEEQRTRARTAGLGTQVLHKTQDTLSKETLATFLIEKETKFIGYDSCEVETTVLDIIKNNKLTNYAKQVDDVEIILETSPFYGESGGQIGDIGRLINDTVEIEIINTSHSDIGKTIIHQGRVLKGQINQGDTVTAIVDLPRRLAIACNHTATHLLQSALRQVLGKHIKQAGSLVTNDYLRFDFTHLEPMNEQEIEHVQRLINEKIRENLKVSTVITGLKEAKELGATALFEEEYEHEVRVVKIEAVPTGWAKSINSGKVLPPALPEQNICQHNFSMELCGGTHIDATGKIGLFKIISETGVASGIRRIEAITGEAAYSYISQQENTLEKLAGMLKISAKGAASQAQLIEKIDKLNQAVKEQEKKIKQLKSRIILTNINHFLDSKVDVYGVKIIAQKIESSNIELLRQMADLLIDRLQSGVVILGSSEEQKVSLVIKISKDLTNKLHAGQLISQIAKIIDGSGGGRPDMAQAGGKNPAGLNEALKKAIEICVSALEKL